MTQFGHQAILCGDLTFTLWPQRHLLGGLGVHLLGGGSLVGHLSKDNTSVSVLCHNRSCSVTELVAPQREPGVIFLVCLSIIEVTCCVDMLCAPPPFWYGRHSLRRQNDPDWLWVCNLSSFIPFAGTSSFVTQWLDSYEKSSRASATVVGSESCCQQRFWGKSLQGLESRISWNPGSTGIQGQRQENPSLQGQRQPHMLRTWGSLGPETEPESEGGVSRVEIYIKVNSKDLSSEL